MLTISCHWLFAHVEILADEALAYQNTIIKLAEADSVFKGTLTTNLATAGELTTSDGGKTWTVDKISIQQSSFDPASSSSARL